MTSFDTPEQHSVEDPSSPSQDFADFCREEKIRRVNSGQRVNAERYDRVVALIMEKLHALETEE